MRIISGKYRGRKLQSPPNSKIRPTTDRIRETLFNIIHHRYGDLEGAVICDAFCGSGALALEALSRGAAKAYLFDKSYESLDLAKQNTYHIGAEGDAAFLRMDCTRPPRAEQACDLIFLDPPYRKRLIRPAIRGLCKKGWAHAETIWIIEQPKDDVENPADLMPLDFERSAGDITIKFFRGLLS